MFGAVWLLGALVVLPPQAQPEEATAAAEMAEVWRKGAGASPAIVPEGEGAALDHNGPFFYLGTTTLGAAEAALPARTCPDSFRIRTLAGNRIVIRGATPAATAIGTCWYAQHAMGVRWYGPAEWEEIHPPLGHWIPPDLQCTVTPAFVSRGLGELDRAGRIWARRNGFHEWMPHEHALARYFPPGSFAEHPEWFPLWRSWRYRPRQGDDTDWQPNLALPEVARHVAAGVDAWFDRTPSARAISVTINDSIRFDQSEATLRARGHLRWFRGRPDYSDLVFGFVNRVADDLSPPHRDRYLSACAYSWCEDSPSFSVRPNIVPWLTADRTQDYDHAYVEEDKALIRRWCRSGAAIVGIYDYIEGAPFLVPRVSTRITAGRIRDSYSAGVRAYYAEANPHWAFDGPKLWIAAQLLWDPNQSLARLEDDYYEGYWDKAAKPMRRFFHLCEVAWSEQTGRAWWLKYYNDESQARLFPPELRARLQACLDEASNSAQSPAIRERLHSVQTAFAAVRQFAAFNEAREALSQAAALTGAAPASGRRLLRNYLLARARVAPAYEAAFQCGCMARTNLTSYMRDDPSARTVDRFSPADPSGEMELMAQTEGGRCLTTELKALTLGTSSVPLQDPAWRTLRTPPLLDDRSFHWTTGQWLATGEPAEGRLILVSQIAGGSASVRFQRVRSEMISQWTSAHPLTGYRATVHCRARVSAGNETFLIVRWMNHDSRLLGSAVADQFPPGDWASGWDLRVSATSPADAAFVGFAVCVANQSEGDFAEFSRPSLERVREK